jgi:hypothetical protein
MVDGPNVLARREPTDGETSRGRVRIVQTPHEMVEARLGPDLDVAELGPDLLKHRPHRQWSPDHH